MNNWFIEFSMFLVRLYFFNIVFMKVKNGMVSNSLFESMLLKMCFGIVCRKLRLKNLRWMVRKLNERLIVVSVKVMGKLISIVRIRLLNINGGIIFSVIIGLVFCIWC